VYTAVMQAGTECEEEKKCCDLEYYRS